MNSHHTPTYRVLVTDHVTPGLTGGEDRSYDSPPQTEQQARALICLLIGTGARAQPGPWRHPIAGGQRIVELRSSS